MKYWPERLFALLLSGLVTLTMLSAFPVSTGIVGATDFKTIYCSAWNLRHGIDAFGFQNVAAVLTANGMALPPAYGHSAVYPPFSLALLAPITFMPLLPAIWLWCVAGWIAISCAFAELAKAAGDEFGAGRASRLVLILIAAVCPLFGFASLSQNVSLVAAALSLLAVTWRDRVWLRAVMLALALLLKPHLALWPAISLLLLRNRDNRRLVLRAVLLCVVFVLASALWLAIDHQLAPQLTSYFAGLRGEVGGGSMSPTQRDVLAAGMQITSLSSLIGFWQVSPALLSGLSWTLLAGLGALMLWATTRINRLQQQPLSRARFVVTAGWCSLGLIATYHRAHDGVILVVLLPWLIPNLRPWPFRLPRLLLSWSTLAFILALGALFVPVDKFYSQLDSSSSIHTLRHLFFYRQAALCAAVLALLLAVQMILLARAAHVQSHASA